ncbi:zinc-ribbon domain-containing protein [Subtercola sp. YIM 133946]|uniref:zinc-ribbon domain-containing protein n=1 Tax=Subtercola sp. YIM 133946 TaxID=3118909 RepID=UPI002F955EA9
MLFIFGSSVSQTIVNVVTFVCGYCNTTAPQQVIRRRSRFTLFFVPLFSYSTTYLNQCTNCGTLTGLTAEQAQHSLDWAEANRS